MLRTNHFRRLSTGNITRYPKFIRQNESSKYWLSVLNELKNRGIKNILILCADGLSGIKESIHATLPETEY